jgi:hypothetical protein
VVASERGGGDGSGSSGPERLVLLRRPEPNPR